MRFRAAISRSIVHRGRAPRADSGPRWPARGNSWRPSRSSSTGAGSTKFCNSDVRYALVNNWNNLFQEGAGCNGADPDACTQLKHAFRRDDVSGTTDVSDRPEFGGRRTTKTIDGAALTGWFTEDFTWDELATLRCRERLPAIRSSSGSIAPLDANWP